MLQPSWRFAVILAICAALTGVAAVAHAQSKDKPNNRNADRAERDKVEAEKAERLPGITAAREAAALEFVKTHHQELSELLIYLREHDQRKYQQAIRDLFRDSERLATIHSRNPEFYEIQLRAWVNRSRIQLLVAKLRMSDDASLRADLRKELLAEKEIQLERLEAERALAAARVERLDEAIRRAQATAKDVDKKQVDKRIDMLLGKSANVSKSADSKSDSKTDIKSVGKTDNKATDAKQK